MRERIAYLFMITILVVLIAVTFGVLGKGEYQPPKEEEPKGSVTRVLAQQPVSARRSCRSY